MNKSTPYIHIRGSRQDINILNDKYMSFEMNMSIMYHIPHLNIEMEGKRPIKVPKSTPKIKNVTFTKWLNLKKRLGDSL